MNLPAAFVEKMQGLLGEEFEDYIKCYEEGKENKRGRICEDLPIRNYTNSMD